MDCRKARVSLPLYYDGTLAPQDTEDFEAHLRACPSCAGELAAIERLAELLDSLAGTALPQSLAAEIRAMLQRQRPREIALTARRFTATKKASLRRTARNIGFVVLVGIVALAVVTYGPWQDWRSGTAGSGETEVEQETQPPITLKQPPKEKPAEPGAESMRREDGAAGLILSPQVVVSGQAYTSADVEDAKFVPAVLEFAERFTARDVAAQQKPLRTSIITQAVEAGEAEDTIARALTAALGSLDGPALPVYAEKARLDAQDAWLIVLVWSPEGASDALSNASVVVVGAASSKVLHIE